MNMYQTNNDVVPKINTLRHFDKLKIDSNVSYLNMLTTKKHFELSVTKDKNLIKVQCCYTSWPSTKK